MNTRYLNEIEAWEYRYLAEMAKAVEESMTKFQLALLYSGVPEAVKLKAMELTNVNFFGLSYRLTPQSEWTGGDTYKTRCPNLESENK